MKQITQIVLEGKSPTLTTNQKSEKNNITRVINNQKCIFML